MVAVVALVTLGSGPSAAPFAPGLSPASLTDPVPPGNVRVTSGDRSLIVAWDSSVDAESGYRVFVDGVLAASPTGLTTTLTGLVNGRSYAITIRTTTRFLVTNQGTVASAPVSGKPLDTVAPAAPTQVTPTRGDSRVSLTWRANSTDYDVDGYRVLRDGVVVSGFLTGPTVAAYTDTTPVNDRSYGYTVQSHDTSGNWSASSTPVATATPTDLTPPAVPAGLVAVRGDREVALSWTANTESDLAGYRVLRDGVVVATVTGTSYRDTGLTNGTTYRYSLAALDTHGNASAASAPPVPATPTDLTPPAVPAGPVATPRDGAVELAWTADPDVAQYRVLRDGVVVATVTAASYRDAGLTNGTTYRYQLVGVDAAGNASAASSPAVPGTPTDQTPPAVPAGLTASPKDGAVELTWTRDPDAARYRVLRDGVVVATVTGASYRDEGLTNGTTYRYQLVAVDAAGNASAASSPAVPGTPADQTPPAVPAGLVATPRDGAVELAWTADPDVAGYRVLRDGVVVATVTGPSYRDAGLTNGTTYRYQLVGVDAAGNASAASSPAVPGTPTDQTPPVVPAGLTASPEDGAVELAWTGDPDVATYRVLRDGTVVATVAGSSYRDTGLTNGTTYRYQLVGVDTAGNASAASSEVPATPTDQTPPAPPTGLTAIPGDGSAVLRWTASTDADVTSHRVLDEAGAVVVTVPVTGGGGPQVVTVSGLVNGTTVTFTVVAVDAQGNVSPRSDPVAVTPRPTTQPPVAVPAQGAGEAGGLAVSGDGRFVVVGTRAPLEAGDTNTAYELYLQDRTAGTARRIAPLPAGATGSTDPTNTSAPAVSDDGRYVALATTAALVPEDTNRVADVYRLDTTTGRWTPVSVPAGGRVSAVAGTVLQTGPSVYATSPSVAMSADGDLVLFYSARTDLVARDTNGVVDVFAKSMTTGVVTRVSATATGTDLPRTALGPALALTPDGRFALFPATSSSGPVVLYRKTLSGAGAGAAVVVSAVVSGGRTTEFSVHRDTGDVDLSDDGRYVALVTTAKLGTTTPTAGWTTGLAHRVDTATGTSVAMGDGQTTSWEHQVALDPTGRYGFFGTAAAMVPGDANGHTDHLRRDLAGGVPGPLVLVTADAAGRAGRGPTGAIAPAEYGRAFPVTGDRVFVTTSNVLQPADTNGVRDLYLADLADGTVRAAVG